MYLNRIHFARIEFQPENLGLQKNSRNDGDSLASVSVLWASSLTENCTLRSNPSR